ncbi:uncharacterized protein [Parasteatoda tepidariorum]|nr:uncharacterized protein LOC107442349 isoform X2 [Parasteatoda tepidariorum]
MYAYWIIFSFCVLSVYAVGPEAVCEKLTEELGTEYDNCYKLDSEEELQIVLNCHKEVRPGKTPSSYSFFEAACKNNDLFNQFYACLFRNAVMQGKNMEKSTHCMQDASKSHGIGWP